jgi:tetratricopeptide (TPR) repeat protein
MNNRASSETKSSKGGTSSKGGLSIEDYEKLISQLDLSVMERKTGQYFYNIGMKYFNLDQWSSAIAKFSVALAQYRAFFDEKKNVAKVLEKLVKANLKLVQKNLDEHNPDIAAAHIYLKDALKCVHDYLDESLDEFWEQPFLEKTSKNLDDLLTKYLQLKHDIEANEVKTLSAKSKAKLGRVYEKQNKTKEAEIAYNQALDLLGREEATLDVVDIYCSIAVICLGRKETFQAALSLDKASALYSNCDSDNTRALEMAKLYSEIGKAHNLNKNLGMAKENYNKALVLSSSSQTLEVAGIYSALGKIDELCNELQSAKGLFSDALRIYQRIHVANPIHDDITRTQADLDDIERRLTPPRAPASQSTTSWCCCFPSSNAAPAVSAAPRKREGIQNPISTQLIDKR